MKKILYHGSEFLIEKPEFGKGARHNDYGRGFYCTENIEFVVDIRPGTIDDIAATDIVALFGNILSNAYEAAKQCEEIVKNILNWLLRESMRQH